MGDWFIIIGGEGPHNNLNPTDANQMARRFVQELVDAGHDIRDAAFIQGCRENVLPQSRNSDSSDE